MIILTSSGFRKPIVRNEILKVLPKPTDEINLLHVTTASKVVKDDSYMKEDSRIMRNLGFKVEEIDLAECTENQLRKVLRDKDIVYVQGGNGFYLLKQSRKSGFGKIIKNLVTNGEIIYIGKSVGSYLVCPTLEMHTWHSKKWRRFGVVDLTALGLVPFLVTAHYEKDRLSAIKRGMKKSKYPVRVITNDQMILVRDGKTKLIGKGKEIKVKGALNLL